MAKTLMIQIQPEPYAVTVYICGAARSRGHELGMCAPQETE